MAVTVPMSSKIGGSIAAGVSGDPRSLFGSVAGSHTLSAGREDLHHLLSREPVTPNHASVSGRRALKSQLVRNLPGRSPRPFTAAPVQGRPSILRTHPKAAGRSPRPIEFGATRGRSGCTLSSGRLFFLKRVR